MGKWKNGKYWLDADGRIPILTLDQLDNIECDYESIVKCSDDEELYEVLKDNTYKPLDNGFTPKTVFISKEGNDTTGELENGKRPFATFMGAYNAKRTAVGNQNGWTFEYLPDKNGNYDVVYTENDIYFETGGYAIYHDFTIHVPDRVVIQCDNVDDKSLFEPAVTTTGANHSVTLRITGQGKFWRNGNMTNPDNCKLVVGVTYLTVESAKEFVNYGTGNVFNALFNTIKNVKLVEAVGGSVNTAYVEYSCFNTNFKANDSVFAHGGYKFNIFKNCSIKSTNSTTLYHNKGFHLDNCYIETEKGMRTIQFYGNLPTWKRTFENRDYYGIIKNCEVVNKNDADNSYNIYQNHYYPAIRIENSSFYIENPEVNTNSVNYYHYIGYGVGVDGYVFNSIFNAEIQNLKTSSSAPIEVDITERSDLYPIIIGQDYKMYFQPYLTIKYYGSSNPDAIVLTVTATTTDPEDLIDLYIAEWNDYAINNPDSFVAHYTISKVYDNYLNHWSIHVIPDDITYRPNIFQFDICYLYNYTEPKNYFINVIDMDNLDKNITINPNYGINGTKEIHL